MHVIICFCKKQVFTRDYEVSRIFSYFISIYLTVEDVLDVGALATLNELNQRHQNSRSSIQCISSDNSKAKAIVQSSQHLLILDIK